jgi:hypothetical protein
MGESGYIVVTRWGDEDLRLMLEAAESLAVDDTVSVTLEGGAHRAGLFWPEPASRQLTFRRIGRETFFLFFSYLANIKPTNH